MELPLNKIINEDCLIFMKTLPDKCIDLVLTDPPYGIGADKHMHKQSGKKFGNAATAKRVYEKTDWDSQIPSSEVFREIMRVSKNQIIFGGNYFVEYLSNSPSWIVWDKNNGDNNFADCELAWTSFKTAVRKVKYTWNGMIQEDMKNKEDRFHPTQKPIEVMKWILDKYSKEGELVLDCFAGGGSTLIACKQLKRNYIGCEISPEYCKIAEERINSISNTLF